MTVKQTAGDLRDGDPSRMRWAAWILVAVVALLTLPPLAVAPGTGLDPSWKVGLHLAREEGLTVGDDLYFTYGPWGFLLVPSTLSRGTWLASLGFHLAVQGVLFLALALWIGRFLNGPLRWAAVLPMLLFAPTMEYRFPLALVLWLSLILGRRRSAPLASAFVGLVAGAAVMIKFSMGLAVLLVVLGGVVSALLTRRGRDGAALLGGFAAGVLVWGLVALGSLSTLGRFLAISWEISTGYGASQVRGGPLWQPIVVLLAVLLLVAALVRKRGVALRSPGSLLLPAGGLLLVVFKHAFVRQETHAFIAFAVGGVLLTWIALQSASGEDARGRLLHAASALTICAGALILMPPWSVAGLPAAAAERIADAWRTEHETRALDHGIRVRETLQERLPLAPSLRELLRGHSVDVMTVETSLVAAWNLDWRPRPLLQSYAVGTSRLDELDATFFAGHEAPERLVVDLQGLDTRHPFMDSPRAWRTILGRYEPLGRDSRWLVLGPRAAPREAIETVLQQVRVPLNEAVAVPRPERGHLEMRVTLRPSLVGRLVALPWKLPEIRVGLVGAELVPPRRILAATAHRPFPLTFPWAETPIGLGALFSERDLPAPSGLAFFTGGSWAWQDAEVEFLQVEWR